MRRNKGIAHKMAGYKRTRAREIAPLVRQGFMKAIENLKAGGTITDISDIWQDIIAQDPAKALELLSRYVPREMLVEVDDARPWVLAHTPMTPEQWLQARKREQLTIDHDSDSPPN